MSDYSDRHPATQDLLAFLRPNPNLSGPAADHSAACWALSEYMVSQLPDSAELSAGLRKLLEAKDCFVRAEIGRKK